MPGVMTGNFIHVIDDYKLTSFLTVKILKYGRGNYQHRRDSGINRFT
jgi:hypothetical protein